MKACISCSSTERNLLDLTDMRMTPQKLISWGNYLSHTPVWPPAQYESPSSVLWCLHPCFVRMQLPAAHYNRYVRRELLEWTPLANQIASSCKNSGFIGFVYNFFVVVVEFLACQPWAQVLFISSVTHSNTRDQCAQRTNSKNLTENRCYILYPQKGYK